AVWKDADYQLNKPLEAPLALSDSEQAAAKALAELAIDSKRALEEERARPAGSTDWSADRRRSADLEKMSKLLDGKTNDEIDRLLNGADQLLSGTSQNLARAGARVWIGDKDFMNENVEPDKRRYTT